MPRTGGVGDNRSNAAGIDAILRSLDPSDVDGLEPPPEIWAGIEATLAAERRDRPRIAPSRDAAPRLTVEYRIDAHDLVLVGDGWAEAAAADDVPELAVPAPGRTLWSHMADGETRDIWLQLVGRVRSTQRPVDIPFRCDGPSARRWFEMHVEPEPELGVRFRSTLVFAESREPVALLDVEVARNGSLAPVVLCAWCGHGRHDDGWVELEDLVRARRLLEAEHLPTIDTGVCGTCRTEMQAELGLAAEV